MAKPDISNKSGPSVLLTGFGPFPGMDINVSARFAKALAKFATRDLSKARINHEILPTQWIATSLAMSAIRKRYRPDIVLHFGVSNRAHTLVIEQVARNICDQCVDAIGNMPENNYVIASAPLEQKSTLPIAEISAVLSRHEIPFEISQDAGSYLCNAVLYQSLHACQKGSMSPGGKTALVGFIHLPAALGKPECLLSWREALTGARNILNACYLASKTRASQTF